MRRISGFPGFFAPIIIAWLLPLSLASAAGADLRPAAGPDATLDARAVAAFADATIPAAMRDGKVPGAVFVVVSGNQIVCEKAYGVADLKMRRAVSVDDTLFRVASISKIFTAASALELVHAHLLDLHRNVNGYLQQLHIAPAFGEPVTLFNLLTHSSGFDDCQFDYAARSPASRLSLRDYLQQHQPMRIRPPGQFSVYDNYGFALAGYLVQKASGIPFSRYVRQQIFQPLDMRHSSFASDDAMPGELATGYWIDDGVPRACGPDYVNITPAAGLCTTASDMADFLSALLTDRGPDGKEIFPAGVLRGLETRQFVSAPDVSGRCFGFNCVTVAGRSALRQTGEWPGFNSVLMLFPKQHCGVFLAYNVCDYLRLEQQVTHAFVEKFIPAAPAADPPDSLASAPLQPLLGSYLSLRSPHDAPSWSFPHEVDVRESTGGGLEIGREEYRRISPDVFERVAGQGETASRFGLRVAFLNGPGGMRLFTQNSVFEQVPWTESRHGRMLLMSVITIVLVGTLVLWPIQSLFRLAGRTRNSTVPASDDWPRLSRAARATAVAACALALWFELDFGLTETRLNPFANLYGFPSPLKGLLWALPVLLALLFALFVFCVLAWRRRLWHPARRIHYTLLAIALALFLYVFYSRHLLFLA
ncbi:MAG TPA: serine hydrolase domain-containing protein [Verrucomicrobiae bacterium]|nr:serine hydrolase domain-containing protein [Verrucomicrobiae bacterium]